MLHLQLALASVSQTTVVKANAEQASTDTVTPTTLIDRSDIAQTPGADSTNSLAMITDYTPGAYLTHDMLHMRGGHQTTWLVDGVPIPNTNIATNLAPQIDPKDVDYVEILRGSYNANTATEPMGSSTSCPARALNGTTMRTGHDDRKLLPDQRSGQFRKPHPKICLLRELER